MRWTSTDVERAITDLDVTLRVAGAAVLLGAIPALGELPTPTAWCVGLTEAGAVALIADAIALHVLAGDPPASITVPLAHVRGVDVDAAASALVVHAPPAPLAVREVPRGQVAAFVAHVLTRLATAALPGDRAPTTTTTTPGVGT